jgi:GT2 family glycosyltransferase
VQPLEFERPAVPGLVSVIVPTRSAEKYIGATLASLGQQVYRDWELVVVEDGSKGSTAEIVANFAQSVDQPVHYFRNDRSYGAGYTRNLAFSKSAGEFIALLDSDDRWLPDHLADSVSTLHSSGADIVYSTVQMVADGTDEAMGVWGPTEVELQQFPQSILGRSFVTPSATVLRRQVLADVGAWSTTHRYCEDYDYWLRCIAAGKIFQFVEGIHCLYRKNHDGATTQKLCGLLEEVAMTTERYMHMPGLQVAVCRQYAIEAHRLAARFHRQSDLQTDPSASPTRAGRILLRAWRLEPRVKTLFDGLRVHVAENLKLHRPKSQVPPPDPFRQSIVPTQTPRNRSVA